MTQSSNDRINKATIHTLEDLRVHLNLPSRGAVLYKAIALLKIATENEDKNGIITLRRPPADELRIIYSDGNVDIRESDEDVRILL